MSVRVRSTVDGVGRVVIPKRIRDEAGLAPGSQIDISYEAGRIEIEPAPTPGKLKRKGRWLVFVPGHELPTPERDIVAETREVIEREASHIDLGRSLPDV